jgi:RNA polymerase sigma-70 factor (ECF subfamily)
MRASAGDVPAPSDASRPGPDTTLAEIRAAQRDPAGAATIYATWFDPIFLYCLRRLGSHEAAEDATSRIFERVLTALPDYRPDEDRTGATFRSWLFAIAHNTIVDHHRRRRFHLSLDRLLHPLRDEPPLQLRDRARPPDDQAIGRDTDRAVRQALTHLPERQRRVVELRLAGLNGPEIATALDTTHSAVKSAQFRAYQTLRETLTALGYAPEDDHASS